jgi:type IV secretion system protein VirB10
MSNGTQDTSVQQDPKAALTRGKIPRNIILSIGLIAALVIGGLGFKYELAEDSKAKANAAAKKAAQMQPIAAPDLGDDLDKTIADQQAKAAADAKKAKRSGAGVEPQVTPALTGNQFQGMLDKPNAKALASSNNEDTIFTSGFFPSRGNALSAQRNSSSAVPGVPGVPDPAQMFEQQQNAQAKLADQTQAVASKLAQNNQSPQERFLTDTQGITSNRPTGISGQLPPCTVPVGFRIFAYANDALDSDLPGDGNATVSRDVYGGRNGECLAIPQGTRIYFKYSSHISVGQERIQVAGVRLTLPNQKTVPLLGMQFGDPDGYTGVSGDVNNHFLKIFGVSLFIAVLEQHFNNSTTAQTVNPNGITTYGNTAGQVAANTAQAVTERNLNIPPTITTKPGQEIILRLDRDITMEPYVE